MKFLVFSENLGSLSQMITYLREKGEVIGVGIEKSSSEAANFGASRMYSIKGDILSDSAAKLLEELFKKEGADSIFLSSSILGREAAGILSVSLGVGIVPEINEISFDGSKAKTKRFYLGGKTVLEEESEAKIFTVSPGISDAIKSDKTSEVVSIDAPQSKIKILSRQSKKAEGSNIEDAKIIVCIGRGLGKKEGIESVKPLVEAVHGEIAGSRPVCLDYQWLGEDRQIGLSGKKVRPAIYVGVGVSGQIQHIAGMRGSKTVIAINKDKTAPIFEEADYGLVGDLYQIIPKIVEKLS
ncbi:MAG: electron transfer flavoprotein alpha subunit [Thermoplasmatales archaeon E-plasma]|nr:MAG: electron transfer flavoprotein alpha subunit [Thermoplasmatales archaeon E-plasma]